MEEKKHDLSIIKKFLRIDYDDDDDLLCVMLSAVYQDMKDLIKDFDENKTTPRQQMIVMTSMKSLYDDREKYAKNSELLKTSVSSMLLKEVYKGV